MSDQYGWQVMDGGGRVIYDQNTIMSRWLGSYNIPFMDRFPPGTFEWRHRIGGIAFNGGTPYAFATPTPWADIPRDNTFSYNMPDIYCGSDYIDIIYNDINAGYPDDTVARGWGLVTVHWGVYNA